VLAVLARRPTDVYLSQQPRHPNRSKLVGYLRLLGTSNNV
jgi:hypothetical protein